MSRLGFLSAFAFALTTGCAGAVSASDEVTGNTAACFEAHGCVEQDPCVLQPGDGGALEICWIQYGEKADTTGKVGLHPIDFWVCPPGYADECGPVSQGDQ